MDEYTYKPGGGLGCIGWMVAGALIALFFMAAGPDSTNTTPGSSISNNRTGTLSGNQVEVMSRNQLNLWSDVQNCYGDYSCITVVTSTTNTTQNTSTDVRTTTTVNGDRNVVIGNDGARMCEDPTTHIYSTLACEGQP